MNREKEIISNIIRNWLTDWHKKRKVISNWMKPKIVHETSSQFPYRCPICWDKNIYESQSMECLEKCWEKLKIRLWEELDKPDPQETGSYQWDYALNKWCGVAYYDDDSEKYYKCIERRVSFITLDELEKILEGGCTLTQRNDHKLPSQIERFIDVKMTRQSLEEKSFAEKLGLGKKKEASD